MRNPVVAIDGTAERLTAGRRRGRMVAAAVVALASLLAACTGGQVEPTEDMVSVGTEAWTGGTPTATDPTSSDPTAGDPTAADPTAANPADPDAVAASADAPEVPADSGAAPVDPSAGLSQIVAGMTVEQKVGQLFATVVIGDDATDVSQAAAAANTALYGVATPAEVVQAYHLGGVAYFDHDQGEGTSNVEDLSATARLSAGLQQAAAADTGIGLLIGADQEGGRVNRLTAPATVFPSARAFGDSDRLDLAEQAGRVTATEARAVGVNWIYAPDADVNANPDNPVIGDRAYGTTADAVVPMVAAVARGMLAGGALPTLKHYPGHGDTDVDSHSSLPTIDHDRATLDAVDLPPFAMAAEVPGVSVMVGHLAVPALDPSGRPATLSPAIMSVLRDPSGLGFDGLVVTDAMNMGALSGFGDSGSLAVQAILAGIDVVLMPTDLPQAHAAVLAAVADGRISPQRLDESVMRVLVAKQQVGVLDAAAVAPGDPSVLGSPAHAAVRQAIGDVCRC